MRVQTHHKIVVGVSDDREGRAAVHVAAELAQMHLLPLHLVRVWREVDWFYSAPASAFPGLVAGKRRDQVMLSEAADQVRRIAPSVPVTAELAAGDLFDILLERSHGAHALVLGGPREMQPKSVVEWMSEHVKCPLLIIDAGGRIVAGTLDTAAAR